MYKEQGFDVIVIGAGHAGSEAALAAARLGMRTCLFAINLDTISQLSCNPAIGGLAKGHIVREIDALGGEMAKIADKSGIQFRMLNLSKGPAVWSLRSQVDRFLYKMYMKQSIENQKGLSIKQAMIEKIISDGGKVKGVVTSLGSYYRAKSIIVTTGTFLKGLIHIGLDSFQAGRAGEFPSIRLSDSLKELGLQMGRLKTGTPPRLDAKTIDFSKIETQWGDDPPEPFSYSTNEITNPQMPCYITYTNETTHKIIMNNLDRSPLYGGKIKGIGPRYCPSIEDKVVRFQDKLRHQVFLEPEGLNTKEYYANGISTSLPFDVQMEIVRSINGLEEAEIMRPAYAIEYDFVFPTQLRHTLEVKGIEGLFLAGQINGTSGYEEAAAQGLIAGINAVLKNTSKEPFILTRDEAYIGVMIDDLIIKGTKEPYRMFTSRAEYRLLLRHDNADFRLMEKGFKIGLVTDESFEVFNKKKKYVIGEIKRLKKEFAKPSIINPLLEGLKTTLISEDISLDKLLKRPQVNYALIKSVYPAQDMLKHEIEKLVEIHIKYEGYIQRQMEMVERLKKIESKKIPECFDYKSIHGLSKEIIEKLLEIQPVTFGQASRIEGITPAAMSILMIAVDKFWKQNPK